MKTIGFEHILPQTMAKTVQGDIIQLKTTEKSHWNDVPEIKPEESASANFGAVLNAALQKVNDQETQANTLQQMLVSDPESVQPHTVMIAMEKARMSLTFAKTIADLAVRTYRELVNLR